MYTQRRRADVSGVMARHRRPASPRLGAAAVLCAAVVLTASGAAALDLSDPIDDILDTVEDTTDPGEDTVEDIEKLPTTDPTDLPDTIVGTVNDTINELSEPEPDSSGDPDGGDDWGSRKKSHRSGTNETTSDGSPQTPGSGTSDDPPGNSIVGPGSGLGPNGSYTSLATQGALAALERALGMAGPLAPPLVLAGIALMAVAGASRGRSRLVKADTGGRFPEHTFKL